MSSMAAASSKRVQVTGLIEIAGINHASGYDFDAASIRRIEGQRSGPGIDQDDDCAEAETVRRLRTQTGRLFSSLRSRRIR
jgi:hypothetical protein